MVFRILKISKEMAPFYLKKMFCFRFFCTLEANILICKKKSRLELNLQICSYNSWNELVKEIDTETFTTSRIIFQVNIVTISVFLFRTLAWLNIRSQFNNKVFC